MKRKTLFILVAIYSCLILSILIVSVSFLISVLKRVRYSDPISNTEYVYVYSSKEADTTISDTESSGWIIKEHSEKIGIFKKDGTLIEVLDTYTKTLPQSDRELLKEGIEIATQEELYSIIQDYSD